MAQQMKDSGIEWIGEIPADWEVTKAKFILSANDGGVWGNDPADDGADKIVIRSTEQTIDGKWCIDTPAIRDLSAIPHASSRILPGDLLITKSSGSDLHIGKTTLADEYFEQHECYFSNFIQRIRCKDYLPKLLWYLFNSNIVREQFVYLQNTTSGIGNINADIIDNLLLPNPPLIMQQRIAAFLDRQCAEIDAVIERTKATIEEYKKLKQAVITEAVTKGVRGARKMKDSGIEWIGEIPEDWEVVRGKNLFVETNERSTTGEEELLTVSHITGITPRSQKNVNMFMSESLVDYKICHVNDIAANTMWMWQGAIGVSKYHGVISPSYNVYRQTSDAYDPDYLDYLLRIRPMIDAYNAYSTGITASRLRLYPEQFLSFFFFVPNREEQYEIVKHLNRMCGEMDNLIAKKTALLTELETYKKSLIYEVVTGKKEVV